jgi:alpha-tubulin suppressor-like RCC1 family protein
LNGNPLGGSATNAAYVTNVQSSSYGTYWAVVTNVDGGATSQVAALSFSPLITASNGYSPAYVAATATNVVAMTGGDRHDLVLRADGTACAWGGDQGQADVPVDATNLVGIAAGSTHSLGLRSDGTVLLWGKILIGTNGVPVEATNVVALGLGGGAQHALALRADGSVLDWGNTNSTYALSSIPAAATNIVAVAAGMLLSA